MLDPTETVVGNADLAKDPHEAEKEEILSWLCTFDMQQKQSETLALRTQGTGGWILSAPIFEEWLSGCSQTSVLWCPGLPHTGKTILTSIVIDHLSKARTGLSNALAYVYCDATHPHDGRPNEKTALLLLSSICRQLASQKKELPVYLRKLYKQMKPEGHLPGIDDVMLVILSLFDSFETVFICIDGLNECDPDGERPILISKLEWMRNRSARMFIGSGIHNRIPEPCDCFKEIFEAFKHDARLMIEAAEEDVRKVLLQRLRKDPDSEGLLAALNFTVDVIIEAIVADCGGMFLTAELKLDREMRRLRLTLEKNKPLPQSVKGAATSGSAVTDGVRLWQIGLQKIQTQNQLRRDLALRTLSWIIHAEEPLQVVEFLQALTIDTDGRYSFFVKGTDIRVQGVTGRREDKAYSLLDDHETSDFARVADPGEMEWDCATSLLEICEGLIVFRSDNGEVCLSDQCISGLSGKQLGEHFPKAQSQMARTCLKFLGGEEVLASDEVNEVKDDEKTRDLQRGLPFKSYARKYWATHLSACNDENLDGLAIKYLRKVYERPARWIEEIRPTFQPDYYARVIDNETPLIKAARYGLNRVLVKLLSSQDYDVEAKSWRRDSAMSVAVVAGHISTVQLLYKHGATVVGYRDRYGYTLLHLAAARDDEIMVPLLMFYGLNPDIQSAGRDNHTPLYVAIESNSVKAANILLKYGADERLARWASAPTGEALLCKAAKSGSLQQVKDLIANGSDVHELDDSEMSALHHAARGGHLAIVNYLLGHGADLFGGRGGPKGRNGAFTPLEDAIWAERQDIVNLLLPLLGGEVAEEVIVRLVQAAIRAKFRETAEALLERMPQNLTYGSQKCQDSLLGIAIMEDDEKMVKTLLDHGFSATLQDEDGWTPLHIAARYSTASVAKVLLDRGADTNSRTKFGMTPIHMSAHSTRLELLEKMLEYDPDLSIQANDGSTALVATSCASNTGATKLLLQRNPSISLSNINGETALHYAVLDNDGELVQDLIDGGIDISIASRKGGSALHLASFKGYLGIVNQLLIHGADIEMQHLNDGEIYVPECNNEWDDKNRPDYWCPIYSQWKPLHSAACGGHSATVDTLLQHGADMSSRGPRCEIPLHLAASSARADTVALLLRRGSEVSASDNAGNTPLHYAAVASAALTAEKAAKRPERYSELEKEMAENPVATYEAGLSDETKIVEPLFKHGDKVSAKSACISALLDYGADPARENKRGFTALALAARDGHDAAVETLLNRNPSSLYSAAAYVKLLKACAAGSKASTLEMISGSFVETEESLVAWDDILDNACAAGDRDVVSLALRKGALPASSTAGGTNLLHKAIVNRHVEIVDLLLGAGADFSATDDYGSNALHIASEYSAKIAEYLLEDGAPVNSRTPNGDTALHFAVTTGDQGIVRKLLQNGASVNIRNMKGWTPLHAAVGTCVFPNIVRMLLQEGACATAQDHAGRTPLHTIQSNSEEGVAAADILLKSGADNSIRARNGDTAIQSAFKRGNDSIAMRLLEGGALVHDEDRKGLPVFAKTGGKRRDILMPPVYAPSKDAARSPEASWPTSADEGQEEVESNRSSD